MSLDLGSPGLDPSLNLTGREDWATDTVFGEICFSILVFKIEQKFKSKPASLAVLRQQYLKVIFG